MSYHDLQYLDLIRDVLANGSLRSDRTGVGTISVFDRTMKFDLRDGSIPMLTSKKMHTKSIIRELLWFISGSTSEASLRHTNTTIWAEWSDEYGELGPVYGEMWREWPTYEIVCEPPRTVAFIPPSPPSFPKQTPSEGADAFVGTVHPTRECGNVLVLKPADATAAKVKEPTYDVQFSDTGYIRRGVRKSVIRRGHIIDVYKPRVNGVGYLGEYDKDDPYVDTLKTHWYKMLERCYDASKAEYVIYGGAGVFVHPEWHCFATFQQQAKQLRGWNQKRRRREFQLDKDYYSSNCYSKTTCAWLSPKDNTLYRRDPRAFTYTLPSGQVRRELSVSNILEQYDLRRSLVHRALASGKPYKGIKFDWLATPPGTHARINRYVDQISVLIHKLRTNPFDRRLMVSGWNPAVLPDDGPLLEQAMRGRQVLPPCHYLFQCYARELSEQERAERSDRGQKYELSLKMNQRSADVGLGVPFNICQYSILLRMLCEVTNMVPGDFIWSGGDVHIYSNHVTALSDQLSRAPYASPKLVLNHKPEIDDFVFEDFTIEGYVSHPVVKMDVAV